MNLKNKSGVTISVLVVTIIVMLILFGITFSTGSNLLRNTQRNKMKTMLYMVKARAEILIEDYLFEYDNLNLESLADRKNILNGIDDNIKLGGTYLDPQSNINIIEKVGFEAKDDDTGQFYKKSEIIYCKWDETELKKQGIDTKNLAQGDTIIVKYEMYTPEKLKDVDTANLKGYSIVADVDVASTKGYRTKDESGNAIAIHSLTEFEEKK